MRKKTSHLCLRETQRGGQLGSLGQRQVLRVLEATLQGGKLEARIDGPWLPHLLGLPVHHPHLGLADLFFCLKKRGIRLLPNKAKQKKR